MEPDGKWVAYLDSPLKPNISRESIMLQQMPHPDLETMETWRHRQHSAWIGTSLSIQSEMFFSCIRDGLLLHKGRSMFTSTLKLIPNVLKQYHNQLIGVIRGSYVPTKG